jgi:hypothetical protein
MKRNYSLFPINIDKHEWVSDFLIKVRFQFLFFQAFNEPGVSLVPGLAVPRTTVPMLSINHTELVNFILAIVSTGTISVGKQSKRTTTFASELQYNISVRGTARPGTRETPGSLKAWKKRNWNRTFIIQIKFNIKYNAKQITKYIISLVLFRCCYWYILVSRTN